MLRPSTLTALGAPSRTSFRSATLTKLDGVFDIGMLLVVRSLWSRLRSGRLPSRDRRERLLFKYLHRCLPLCEPHGRVGGGSAVLVRANVRSTACEADEKLVAGGMPATALPFLKHGAEGRQRLGVGV